MSCWAAPGLRVAWTDHLVPFQPSARVLAPPDPAAMQAVGEVHDTLFRSLSSTPGGLGVAWTDHVAPCHASARVLATKWWFSVNPVAVQAVAEVHEMPSRAVMASPLGVRWIDHEAPFHRSASVNSSWALLTYNPTAVHAVTEAHETPRSLLPLLTLLPPPAPLGLGVAWTDQVVPFQASARV